MTIIQRGIFIDDAGTPGVVSKSEFLPEDRKSYCAVIVPNEVVEDLSKALTILYRGVKQDFDADELHFTDIYSGRGVWKGVKPALRKEIFDFMLTIMEKFSLPIIYQTSSRNLETSQIDTHKTRDGDWWDYSNVSHQALIWLCFVTSKQIRKYRSEPDSSPDFDCPFETVIDEGLMKAGSEVELPNWGDVFLNKKIKFRSSQSCPGIQLADFAAFCISRAQWLAARLDQSRVLTEADRHIFESSGKLNVWNLLEVELNPETFSREEYECVIQGYRKELGLTHKLGKNKD
jgi:hypothetical protein